MNSLQPQSWDPLASPNPPPPRTYISAGPAYLSSQSVIYINISLAHPYTPNLIPP